MEKRYRRGNTNGRNLYLDNDHIGVLFDPEDTEKIVRSLNSASEIKAIRELLAQGMIHDAAERETQAPDRQLYFVVDEAVDRLDELQ